MQNFHTGLNLVRQKAKKKKTQQVLFACQNFLVNPVQLSNTRWVAGTRMMEEAVWGYHLWDCKHSGKFTSHTFVLAL
jgi:hypothetical protein